MNHSKHFLNVTVVHWCGRPPDLGSSSMDVLPDLKRWYHWWYCVRLKQILSTSLLQHLKSLR